MKVDRLISIIMILLDKERISAQTLADMFEVSLRTIYRDLDAIDLAGIPIRAISGVGGGYEIMPKYKLDKKVFSTAELSTILIGLSSVSNMLKGDELMNALVKVKSFIPSEKAKEIELKTNQISIDVSQWMGNSDIQPYIDFIKSALQDSKLLSLSYIAHHGSTSIRTVEPYQLILKSNHWYLYGYCLIRNDYRLFRISRMSNLQILEKTFLPRDYQKPQLEFHEMLKTMQIEIEIRIHISLMDRVLDYCTYDNFILEDEEHFIVKFPFVENDYHYDILLGFGSKCECLMPHHVREQLKRKIQNLRRVYES